MQVPANASVVLEGRFVIARALALPYWRVRLLRVTPAARHALASAIDALPEPRRPAIEVMSQADLAAVTGVRFHQGCLAYAERPPALALDDLDLGLHSEPRRVLVLEDVRDPDNVGSIFRSALAFGARAVLLGPGCADPLYRKTIRTSMAASLALPFVAPAPWPDALDWLRARQFTIVATTPDSSAGDLRDAAPQLAGRDVAVLVGSEGAGLSDAAFARADIRVRVPTGSDVDSLNVATAAAIVLYALG